MKFFGNLAVKTEKRSSEIALSLRDPALKALFTDGARTSSGVHVGEHTALKIGAVYACINDISQDIAKMPFHTYRDLGDKGRVKAVSHPVYRLLKTRPNPLMTSTNFRHAMQAYLLTWGNAWAEIEFNGAGFPIALWPWRPDRVRLQIFNRKLFYYYTDENGAERQFRADQVLHLRGIGDGILGHSVISLHREAMGLCVASQEYRARFFANDARPGGVLQHPGVLGQQAHDNLRRDMNAQLSGANRRSFAILEEGMQWKDVGIPPNDAQFIEGWQAGKEDIAGIYRMPPYKIGILKPGTVSHASVEQAALDYYTDCLLFWAITWEQGCDAQLFTERESEYYTKLSADHILRADSKTRAEVLQIWRRNGIINADEWREKEDMNPLPDDLGKKYTIEANMTTLEKVGEEPEPAPAPKAEPQPRYLNGHARE